MRKRVLITSLALLASSFVVAAPAAQASGCHGFATTSSTWTHSHSTYAGCNTQARIDTYYNGYHYVYKGAWGTDSHAHALYGYVSGHSWRLGGSGWMSAPGSV